MLYDLKIAPSLGEVGVSSDFFQNVESDALAALSRSRVSPDEALAIAEYLDCVDSNAIENNVALYARCVAGLSAYLSQTHQTPKAQAIAEKSPAAMTLLSMASISRISILPVPLARVSG